MSEDSKEPQPPAGAPKPAVEPGPAAPTAEELAALRLKAGEHDKLMDRLKRVTADYLNSQKRLERHADERVAYAIESFARELLTVVDDLARAIKAAREHAPDEKVSSGLELTEKHLYAVLARHGITPVETKVGEPFDSNGHEAVAAIPTDQMPPNCVVEELQRGFRMHGRMLRPARVAVSAAKANNQAE